MWNQIDWNENIPKMRFNEKELKTLAAQHKCEKEGNLFFRERQEGFFRKAEGENFTFLHTKKNKFDDNNVLTRPRKILVKCSIHHVCFSTINFLIVWAHNKQAKITNFIEKVFETWKWW